MVESFCEVLLLAVVCCFIVVQVQHSTTTVCTVFCKVFHRLLVGCFCLL